MRPPAAPTTAPFTDWTNLEHLGVASVIVTLDDGDTVKGKAVRETDTGLYVATDESVAHRFLARESIVRVVHVTSEVAARAKSGALLGLGLGAMITIGLPGLWFTLLADPAELAGLGALSGIPLKHQIIVFDRR